MAPKGLTLTRVRRVARCTLCALQPYTRGKALELRQHGRMDGPPAGKGALWCGVAGARGRASTSYYIRERCGPKGSRGAAGAGVKIPYGGSRGREGRNAGNVLGWPRRCKLAHAFLWEYRYSYTGLKLAQLLGQLGVFLTRQGVPRGAKQPRVATVWKRLREVSLFEKRYSAASSAHAMANEGTSA
jgi:hypothetical protein